MTAKIIKLTIKAGRKKQAKPRKKSATSPRQRLLAELRAESKARQWSAYSMKENTPLVELAREAAYSTKRSITWCGIRFPLRHGWFLTVLDPETGAPLISTKGGVF